MEESKNANKQEGIDEQLLRVCGNLLQQHRLRLLCAESMTAGYLSSLWGMEINSGNYFLGSIVCYHTAVKTGVLGVPAAKINKYCAESAVVTLRMLDGLRKLVVDAEVYVSITGLAFKTENAKQLRSIGTVYYAFHYAAQTTIFKRHFTGDAATIFIATCNALLHDLYHWLLQALGGKKFENNINW